MPTHSLDEAMITELTETSGVPGYEDRVRTLVQDAFDESVDRVRTDAMGNVVGTIDGSGDHEVAVAAHMDEIGFMVSHIESDEDGSGFLELDPLGGWDPRVLKAQRVTVHTEDGDLPGVIGSPPPHTMDAEEREATPDVDDVYIDLGLPAEDVEDRVAVGDLVTMDQSTETVGELLTGKAMDDRICLYAMLQTAAAIEDPDATIHFCATVQEEVGLRGARALGVDVDPDLAIAMDVTVANDVPEFDEGEHVTRLGDGTAIKLKDGSVITSPKVHRRFKSIAEDEEIDYQLEVLPAGGTDTAGFQHTHGAKPVGALSIPNRYMHTVTEAVHRDDVAATVDLLTAFLEREDGTVDYTL
ncbi:peptidase family protein [Halovivax ruber XH-70]|uniref:Peptidase family protein n=1 Tax=Halovivax ruber (strain DSM 18193 / JCM 13892 / XH-70) TaxID=797302 RepID=L0IA48_HALRX|nr:M42 family metallopeptidase [Halovivax ruber]AGB15703.1 peptidase family protein [Halovivax ruber XH-70]